MKYKTPGILGIILLFSFHPVGSAADTGKVGVVHEVNPSSRDITVAVRGGTVQIGQKLYMRLGGKAVVMVATFPMMSKSKVRLLPGYGKYLGEIKKNMPVYAYVPAVEKDRDEAVIQKSGSLFELAMLCGKPIDSDNVQEYIAKLGPDVDKSTWNDSIFYSYQKLGVSVKFKRVNNPPTVWRIILYSQGADKFDAYPHELPEKIQFSETRAQIEKKIGPPAKIDDYTSLNTVSVQYPLFGLEIDYTTNSLGDMNARIHHVVVWNPENPS